MLFITFLPLLKFKIMLFAWDILPSPPFMWLAAILWAESRTPGSLPCCQVTKGHNLGPSPMFGVWSHYHASNTVQFLWKAPLCSHFADSAIPQVIAVVAGWERAMGRATWSTVHGQPFKGTITTSNQSHSVCHSSQLGVLFGAWLDSKDPCSVWSVTSCTRMPSAQSSRSFSEFLKYLGLPFCSIYCFGFIPFYKCLLSFQ